MHPPGISHNSIQASLFSIGTHILTQTFTDFMGSISQADSYDRDAIAMMDNPFKRNEYIFTRALLRGFVYTLAGMSAQLSTVEKAVANVWL